MNILDVMYKFYIQLSKVYFQIQMLSSVIVIQLRHDNNLTFSNYI